MKIYNLIVDKLPETCGDCMLRTDNYCMVKAASTPNGQAWVDRHCNERNSECPLSTVDDLNSKFDK